MGKEMIWRAIFRFYFISFVRLLVTPPQNQPVLPPVGGGGGLGLSPPPPPQVRGVENGWHFCIGYQFQGYNIIEIIGIGSQNIVFVSVSPINYLLMPRLETNNL